MAGIKRYSNNSLSIKFLSSILLISILASGISTISGLTSETISKSISFFGQINAEASRPYTDGRWIKDATGNVVRLKGSAIFWRFMYCSNYTDYNPLAYEDEINETSLDLFASTGANFIRLTVNGYLWSIKAASNYIAAVDMVIDWCKARGIWVVLDNHGWWDPDADGGTGALYKAKDQLAEELTEWQAFMVTLAQRYKNEPTVIGFDMLNEPSTAITWPVWRANVLAVARSIHAVDPSYLCFVEPLGSATDIGQMDNFKTNPLPERNIVYCAHNYYAWDYPWYDYANSYGNGNFALVSEQMEALYYERWMGMIDANLPVMNMETGVYMNSSRNPNWNVWENDSLTLYEKFGIGVCWFSVDPYRSDSSLISLLGSDRQSLTQVGTIWAIHMNLKT